jgi:malate synthase
MYKRIQYAGLSIAEPIYNLVTHEICPANGVEASHFWQEFATIINELAPQNIALLKIRTTMQSKIDCWLQQNSSTLVFEKYKQFLIDISYLIPEGENFHISPKDVDIEVAHQAGPQLVVPITNARFALNAVNARWGSLYDALYGNDLIPQEGGAEKSVKYNPVRGQKVIDYSREFLDNAVPISTGSHRDAVRYSVLRNKLVVGLVDGSNTSLRNPEQFAGYLGNTENPTSILLKNNRLHIDIQVDYSHHVGVMDRAGIKDIILEAAITTIMDCEDSVAAVDAGDKALAYRNWFGLIKGDLQETIHQHEECFIRKMNKDRDYKAPDGSPFKVHGRSLMFIRNVGHLMTNPSIIYGDGLEVPEGIMDGMITALIAIYDLNKKSKLRNSRAGSIYIVKPKMHGPDEVTFTNVLFNRIEDALGLKRHTIKVGIMDEERRTSINLKECIRAAKNRVVFINTGFLDRTGDEIHTSMHAGAFALKADLKTMRWINAYEDQNVDVGIACGLPGKAQIGKGMWPVPDNMADMMKTKIAHPQSGANTAWVPSPTAATLHAIHYHQVDVCNRQKQLTARTKTNVDDMLDIPLLGDSQLTVAEIQKELDNNVQGILGYVVRWIDQGIGCSKVPDIHNIGLMEDRATLRISSQHIANWICHGICTNEQVMETLKRMAAIVDDQNSADNHYLKMSTDFNNSVAFRAACDLIFKGIEQPNGYTEPLLHGYRAQVKSLMA